LIQKRIYTIDIARTISIILVVTGHFQPDDCPEWWLSFHNVLQTFRMPLFMAVSGYTYIYLLRERRDKDRNYGSFIWHKFQRLMIPYFFISVFIIGTKLLAGGAGSAENPVSPASLYEMFYYPAAAPFVWFVYVLFMVFLIVPHFNTRKGLTVLFVIALMLHFAPIYLPDIFSYVNYFKIMLLFFVTGAVFYEWRNVRAKIMSVHFLVYVVSFVLFYLLAEKVSKTEIHFMAALFTTLASLSGVSFIIKFAKFISESGRIQQVFLSVAACSYTIYLFHTTFMGFTKAMVDKFDLVLGDFISTTFVRTPIKPGYHLYGTKTGETDTAKLGTLVVD